jgi:hypothetical protein
MSKGQKRNNREPKKPKSAVPKPPIAAASPVDKLIPSMAQKKPGGSKARK